MSKKSDFSIPGEEMFIAIMVHRFTITLMLGEKTLGTVSENSKHEYILEIEPEGKQVKLKERYLKALQEASKIFEERLSIAHKEENRNF